MKTDVLARVDKEADERVCSRSVVLEQAAKFLFDCIDNGEGGGGVLPDIWTPDTFTCPKCDRTVRGERTNDGDLWFPAHPGQDLPRCVMSEQMLTPHKRGGR